MPGCQETTHIHRWEGPENVARAEDAIPTPHLGSHSSELLTLLVLWAWITLPSDPTQNVLSPTKICSWMGVQGSTPGLHVKSHVVHGKQASTAGETWKNHNKLCDAVSQEGAHVGVRDCPALSLRKETDWLSACQLFP